MRRELCSFSALRRPESRDNFKAAYRLLRQDEFTFNEMRHVVKTDPQTPDRTRYILTELTWINRWITEPGRFCDGSLQERLAEYKAKKRWHADFKREGWIDGRGHLTETAMQLLRRGSR